MENFANKTLCILHFNDVYNIEEKKHEPVGGVARFKTAMESVREPDSMTFFSGDLFHPSLLSTVYDGDQTIKPMNALNVDVSCFGNHEFDLELEKLTEQIGKLNHPWLISNVITKEDQRPLAGGQEIAIIERKGVKIGLMGLAEGDWVFDVSSLNQDDIIYEDFVECAKRLTRYLREVEKCDMVIALTHLRLHNDERLAREFTDLDLILGGHDHINCMEKVNGTYIIKSGSDFVEFNKINLTILEPEALEAMPVEQRGQIYKGKYLIDFKTIEVTKAFEPDTELKEYVDECMHQLGERMKQPVLYSTVPLDTRFDKIRGSEQNFADFLADVIRLDSETDCAMINSGTFRSDILFPEGVKSLADIRQILPFEDTIMKIRITGKQLHEALENSVSTYPSLDGRFPAVSGISFAFDPKKETKHRIPFDSIKVRGAPIDLDAKYTLATSLWIYEGKDGYTMLHHAEKLNEPNVAEGSITILKRFFTLTKDPRILEDYIQVDYDEFNMDLLRQPSLHRKLSEIKRMTFYGKLKPLISTIVQVGKEYLISIAPHVENRIVKIE